jgi:hypothetical protein
MAACTSNPYVLIEHPVARIRIEAIPHIEDQEVLARVALEDPSDILRKAAVSRLNDQVALTDVALNDSESSVRRAAVERVVNDSVLQVVALSGDEHEIRAIAAQRIGERVSLDNQLADVAIYSNNRLESVAATALIREQNALSRVLAYGDATARQVAHVSVLVFSSTFQTRYPGSIIIARGHPTNQRYAAGVSSAEMRGDEGAIEVVHNGSKIGAFYWGTDYPDSIRTFGPEVSFGTRLERIETRQLIDELVKKLDAGERQGLQNSDSFLVRAAIAPHMAQQQLEASISHDADEVTRASAIGQSNNQELKAHIAKTDPSVQVRLAAIQSLMIIRELRNIMNTRVVDETIRMAATRRHNELLRESGWPSLPALERLEREKTTSTAVLSKPDYAIGYVDVRTSSVQSEAIWSFRVLLENFGSSFIVGPVALHISVGVKECPDSAEDPGDADYYCEQPRLRSFEIPSFVPNTHAPAPREFRLSLDRPYEVTFSATALRYNQPVLELDSPELDNNTVLLKLKADPETDSSHHPRMWAWPGHSE